MAIEKKVKLPTTATVNESFLVRVLIEGQGDMLDMMALQELQPVDLKFILNEWVEKYANTLE